MRYESMILRVKQNLAMILVLVTVMFPAILWAGTLRDDFNDGNMDGWDTTSMVTGGTWKLENGELVITSKNGVVTLFIGEDNWKDYTVSVKAKIVTNHVRASATGILEGIGVIIRDFGNYPQHECYLLPILNFSDYKGMAAYYTPSGITGMWIADKPFQLDLDKWYDIKAIVEGNQFRFSINDEFIIEFNHSAVPKGKIGISAFYTDTTAHFDDFSVIGNDIPDTVTSVSQKDKLAIAWGMAKYR